MSDEYKKYGGTRNFQKNNFIQANSISSNSIQTNDFVSAYNSNYIMTINNDIISANSNRIRDLAPPLEDNDAARIIDAITYIGTGTYPATTSQVVTSNEFNPLFMDSDRVNGSEKDGIAIEYLNLPTGIATPQDGNWWTLNTFQVGDPSRKSIINRGVYRVKLLSGGVGHILFNRSNGISRVVIIPTNCFEDNINDDDYATIKYLNINNKKIKVVYQDVNGDGRIFKVLNQSIDDIKMDYLRITNNSNSGNFQQLAELNYEVFLTSNSTSKFYYRLATYDINLNRVNSYEIITYDPSNNPQDPTELDYFGLNGTSITYDKESVYVFMEFKVDTGSIAGLEYKYASFRLETGLNTSIEYSGKPQDETYNIFNTSYFQFKKTDGNIDRDLSIIKSEISQLQIIQGTQQSQITGLDSGKLNKTGDIMSGILNMNNNKITNIETPSQDTDATNKEYVDGFLPLAGGDLTGIVTNQQRYETSAGGGVSFIKMTLEK